VNNDLACTLNTVASQLQYNGGPGGDKNSAPSLSVPSGQSSSSNVGTRPLSTSGEYIKNAYGSLPVMVDHRSNMKPSSESSNNSHRLMTSNTNASLCYSYKDKIHITPETNALVTKEKDSNQIRAASSQHFVRTVSRAQTVSQEASASVFASKPLPGPSLVKNTYGGFSSSSAHLGHPNFCNQQPNDGCLQRKSESLSGLEARGHSPLFVQPALENGSAQKGPRIANVVHRFKSSVELLELGAVLSGRLWSSSQAIFPKGFRSRVKYFSIVDPTQMTYYISEILDAGLQGPLFMVSFSFLYHLRTCSSVCLYLSVAAFTGDYRKLSR
jgi:histone demethylase JARID1